MSGYLEELEWRGLLYQTAGQDIEKHLSSSDLPPGGRVGYCGFDPTSDSLTIGNYNSIMLLRRWQDAGHTPIILMGGGTGLIGDPSGKDAERLLLTPEQIEANVARIKTIFDRVLDFDPARPNAAVIVNNADWLVPLSYVQLLRDVGKHFSVNVMIQKESVRERLHNRDHGISYTEFSYMILQAYDFLHLRREMNCTVQVAGSDQYGNIVAGMDLIRREFGPDGRAFGVTSPLVLKADGTKFGKSETGAVWLTADRTSPYAFYQFWLNVDDTKVIEYLKRFTFLDRDEIESLEEKHNEAPHQREAQRTLARALTSIMHGDDALAAVETAAGALFGRGDVRDLSGELLDEVFVDVPSSDHVLSGLQGDGLALSEFLPETSLASSRRQAREFLGNGAVFVNGQKAEAEARLTTADLLHGRVVLLRRGKRSWHATRWA